MKTKLLIIFFAIATIANAQYIKLLDFASAPSARNPQFGQNLISDGTFLYGITERGGTYDIGIIFKIKTDGTGYTNLLDFAGTANGSWPHGSLISDGIFLYGMTYFGGINDMGTILKIKPDGTGYAKLMDFSGATNGSYPLGSLISDGTFLYGMTSAGGTNDSGVVFKIKSDGTGYSKLLDFSGVANGRQPYGSLIYDGTFLYGMTTKGGINNIGTIFKIKSDGTGYSKLMDFSGAANGSYPLGSLISDGTFLYGMTSAGGTNDSGVVFKIKFDGTGYSKLFDFSFADGYGPFGDLISDGTFLYGMTTSGGTGTCTYGCGVIFRIKPDGTGYAKLLYFSGATNGSTPLGSLMSDGIFLYGMTFGGGTNYLGTIFKFHPVGMSITENNAETDFTIYPNPSSGKFTIESEKEITGIEIINVLGEKVYSLNHSFTPSLINLSSQPNGIYFLHLKTEQGTATKKIIINK